MDYEVVGSIKIKDGLFLGDEYAAQDLEFVVTNKVQRIINCAGKQIPNHWNTIGVQYLTYGWLENDNQTIFDPRDEVLHTTFKFIDEALAVGDAVLVHSVRGHNRAVCIIASYMMRKFRWTLYKTLEFLHARRPDLEIRASFFNQLLALENRLAKIGLGAKTYNWKEVAENKEIQGVENEEVLLTNTFLNSKNQELAEYNNVDDKEVSQKIRWIDEVEVEDGGSKGSKEGLNKTYIPPYDSCKFNKHRYSEKKSVIYKSIVKGTDKNDLEYIPNSEKSLDKQDKQQQQGKMIRIQNSAKRGKFGSQKDLKNSTISPNNFMNNGSNSGVFMSSNNSNQNTIEKNRQGNENEDEYITQQQQNLTQKYSKYNQNQQQGNNNNMSEDQKLQNSLNQIANRQLRDAFPQNQENEQPQQQQQQYYGGQQMNSRNNKLQVQKVYGQKLGGKKNSKQGIKKDYGGGVDYQGRKKPQNNYLGNSSGYNSRLYGTQQQQNQMDMYEENNFMGKQQQQQQQQQYSYDNNFKNTQKIYSAPLGIVGRQTTQVNNFTGGGQTQSKLYEMPSLNQNRHISNNNFPNQDNKVLKRNQRPSNRPSTAPSKQKDNNNTRGPVNGFSMRNNFKNNTFNNSNNNNHQDLFITGQQRQKSANQNNKNDDFMTKKQRCSSPGNFYSQNTYGKGSNKWKV